MARVGYRKALEDNTLEIVDKYLVVDTKQDGYFNIYKGAHPFRVVELNSEGDLAVYPTYFTDKGKLTNEPHPIIRTVGDEVFFVKRTLSDPYNGPELGEVNSSSSLKAHKVLDAFNVFAESEFSLGHPNAIHVFIGDDEEVGIEDAAVEFEYRDASGEKAKLPVYVGD